MTQQIDDRFAEFETDNQMFITARQAVHQARQGEDTAFKRFSGKDFASDDLKREDALEDKYMSTALGILNGLLYLPETEPMYRKAHEERAKLYYISGGKTSGDKPTPTPDGGSDSGDSSDSGDVTPVTPDPTPDPDPSSGGSGDE